MSKNDLSLAGIYNMLNEFKSTAGEKINYLYDIFSETQEFPVDITIDQDAPGLWPSNGIQLYAVLPQMNISEDFCTNGIIVHFASNKYCLQIMYVINDIMDKSKNNKIYFRAGSEDTNSWNEWELINTSTNTFQSLTYKGFKRRQAKEVVINVDPKINYVEIALAIGSYYSSTLKREYINKIFDIDEVIEHLNDKMTEFSGNLLDLKEGDVIIYDTNSYIAIYDGAGGCFGSSVNPGSVEHFDNCLDINNMLPTHIVKP